MAEQQLELEQQFEKLHQLIGQKQHKQVLKVTDAILKFSPGDIEALQCKAVAYLELGEYEEATKVLSYKQLQGQMQFERAYCCYRLGKFSEARHSRKCKMILLCSAGSVSSSCDKSCA
eukprot:GHRR01026505.1.p1 GENE.GHRR01026505.1~~GHRR01026505.1.p1  ORF type:complete len:118 (+),score=33.92 GHRR01026505.1:638-991(+)